MARNPQGSYSQPLIGGSSKGSQPTEDIILAIPHREPGPYDWSRKEFLNSLWKWIWVYEDKTNYQVEEFGADSNCTCYWPKDIPHQNNDQLRLCCNGARKWAWLGLLRMVLIFLVVPIAGFHLSDCDDAGKITANIVGNDGALAALFWIGGLSSAWYINLKALSYFWRVQVKGLTSWTGQSLPLTYPLKHDKLPFLDKIPPAKQWYIAITIFSCAARQFAYMWNAEVVGMLVKTSTAECQVHGKLIDAKNNTYIGSIDEIWAVVVSESAPFEYLYRFTVDMIPEQFNPGRTFGTFVVPIYLLGLLQPLMAYLAGRKITRNDKHAKPRGGQGSQPLLYATSYAWSGTNDMSAFMLQADMACMDACIDLQTAYVLRQLDHLEAVNKVGTWDVEDMTDYLHLIVSQMERILFRFGLVGIAQNVVTANVQASLFAAMYQSEQDFTFWMALFPFPIEPIALNMLMCLFGTFPAVLDSIQFFSFRRKLRECKSFHESIKSDQGTDLSIQRLYRRAGSLGSRLKVYIVVYIFVTAWTLSKLFMMFFCTETGLYNFKYSKLLAGHNPMECVEMSAINHK